jgi:hypothetical protein
MASTPTAPAAGIDLTWLTKFIRKQLEDFPTQFISQLSTEELSVLTKLTVADLVEFTAYGDWRFIGSAGQPAFTASWVAYGPPYANPSFTLLPDGFVTLHGVIKSGTIGSSAFTLPPGYRPSAPIPFAVVSNGVFGRVDVGADGTVTPISPSSNLSVVLDQIRFKAA